MIRSPAGPPVLWTWARSVLLLIPLGHLVLLRPYNKPSSIFSAADLCAHPVAADLPGPPALTQPFLNPHCPQSQGCPGGTRRPRKSVLSLGSVPLVASARPREERNHFTRMWSLTHSPTQNNGWNLATSD